MAFLRCIKYRYRKKNCTSIFIGKVLVGLKTLTLARIHRVPNKIYFKTLDLFKLSRNNKFNLNKKAKTQRAFEWRKSILLSNKWNFTPKQAEKFHGEAKELKY